jgi:hypothetical protein
MAIANTAGWNGVYSDASPSQMKIGAREQLKQIFLGRERVVERVMHGA